MKPNMTIGIFAVATLALTSGSVLAQQGAARHGNQMTFEALDADGDGEITPAEMDQFRQSRFSAVDTNGDGKLTADEIQAEAVARAAERAKAMIERYDTDKDGALSPAEMPGPRDGGERMFKRMDLDGNGTVSKAEFDQARDKMKNRMDRKGMDGKGMDRKGMDGKPMNGPKGPADKG